MNTQSLSDPSRPIRRADLASRRQFLTGLALAGGAVWPARGAAADAAQESPPKRTAKILLVTGVDYPGHHWRETAPELSRLLMEDSRLAVFTIENPNFLDSSALRGYDAALLHFMNWERPAPGPAARENLRGFVAGGKGLMLVHFACGAWQDWPEFRRLAGRVYDPKLPPHDPRGPFRVRVADHAHPITAGLADFGADDELYTCLTGDAPIRLLAAARSRVTGRDEPMAFALEYGRGRVFHSPLGHDVRALQMPGVRALFRRGCAWAAGLKPAR